MDDQRQDEAERESLNYAIAQRLQYCVQDGYLLPNEFEHVLYEMGILKEWKSEQKR